MIASLTGSVQAKSSNSLVLDVSGVGYLVWVPTQLLSEVSEGSQLTMHTALIVREDAFVLFGFSDREQLALFDLLRSVSGVGPKIALAILSTLTPADIANAVASEDSKAFERVSGVGLKTAKLISVTLAGKLKTFASDTNGSSNQLLLEALQGLGWPERVAEPVVREVMRTGSNRPLAELIRESLKILGSKN
ncbi:MAG: Holliday junction branch migration protein RuvA [Rhodoluna sp.]|nr:Holliday junction branch migration protein RuvA [Rhodoluna sp.]